MPKTSSKYSGVVVPMPTKLFVESRVRSPLSKRESPETARVFAETVESEILAPVIVEPIIFELAIVDCVMLVPFMRVRLILS